MDTGFILQNLAEKFKTLGKGGVLHFFGILVSNSGKNELYLLPG
jgi:hypothetical protein